MAIPSSAPKTVALYAAMQRELPLQAFLSLAAAPTFVVMTVWSVVAGGPAEMMCSSGGSALSLNGMAAMYALMSGFHVSPWLALLSEWGKDDGGRSSACLSEQSLRNLSLGANRTNIAL